MAESDNVDYIQNALALVMAQIADAEALLAKVTRGNKHVHPKNCYKVVVCYYMLTRRNKHVKSAGHIQKSYKQLDNSTVSTAESYCFDFC